MINNGIPEEAVEISVSSLAQSSLKQYTNGLKLWWEFCHQRNINCFELNSQAILCFLSRLYGQGRSYSSLNTTRSALSLLISPRVGEDHQIKRFFKGVFKLRPPLPKYHVTWDPAVVLGYLETCYPNNTISLEALTHKLSMLMALVTAHRVQTLSVIEVPNIEISESKIEIKVSARVKTSAPNRYQPLLILPFFHNNPKLCVASTLKCYLNRTRDFRQSGKLSKLFLTHKKPYKEATAQSISRWIRIVLDKSGIDTSIFTAHSTRHASTSAAVNRGINIDTIRNTAGWTSSSNVFARFYNRPVKNTDNFADAILRL
ncbi:unnamed protein product [Acanthoscelides obtectus]|uniref:Tyr recombinase domain-containing protein n=1 Tax=Acanthoscelides obtectus TaxID=200917 RepID=A0A9P0KIM8_ACAOB|nr:unnamed protein product [Acanthoscelides obtectus]CAK1662843.1 hypothetical protein AOBTE_LOCUS23347 [Acanthoscelides obtectus]